MAWGTGDDLRATAALLDKVDASLVASYANKTGQSSDDIAAWMAAETWFTSAEAVDLGFADEVASGATPTNAGSWNLSAYSNSPPLATGEPPTPEPKPQEPAPPVVVPPAAQQPVADFAAMKRRLALTASH
jgi:ATP-dependent Clp protease protease subunit